jgi:hypothetical protein
MTIDLRVDRVKQMAQEMTYVTENRAALARLQALVAGLSDTQLAAPVGEWTVATVLVHLAYWDRARLALLQRWVRDGVSPAPSDSEIINPAVNAIAMAIPPRAACQLALDAAAVLDQALERITPELAGAIEASGNHALLYRAVHRNGHLDDIEQSLRQK